MFGVVPFHRELSSQSAEATGSFPKAADHLHKFIPIHPRFLIHMCHPVDCCRMICEKVSNEYVVVFTIRRAFTEKLPPALRWL